MKILYRLRGADVTVVVTVRTRSVSVRGVWVLSKIREDISVSPEAVGTRQNTK